MPTSISLNKHFESFIQEQINSGRYNNVSEVVRAGLRELEEKQHASALEELKTAIASGQGKAAENIFARLRNKYQGK